MLTHVNKKVRLKCWYKLDSICIKLIQILIKVNGYKKWFENEIGYWTVRLKFNKKGDYKVNVESIDSTAIKSDHKINKNGKKTQVIRRTAPRSGQSILTEVWFSRRINKNYVWKGQQVNKVGSSCQTQVIRSIRRIRRIMPHRYSIHRLICIQYLDINASEVKKVNIKLL